MNVAFEQVGAALANMTAQGTPTAQATTQLNQLIAELGKSGTEANKGLMSATQGTKYANKGFSDLMAEGVPLSTLLDLMSVQANKSGESLIDMFGSIEAGKSALALSGKNTQQYTKNLKEMSTTVDVVGDAYEKVTDTFENKSQQVVNALKNVGIQAYSQFQEPLKGAMDSANEAIGELRRNLSSPKTQKSIEKIATAFGKLITIAIDLATAAIPLLINSFSFVVDNGEILITVLAGITAGMIANKIATEATTKTTLLYKGMQYLATVGSLAYATAQGVLAGNISLTNGAMTLFNAIMGTSPIGWIALSIGAVVAGFTALALISEESVTIHDRNIKAIKAEVEAYEELKDQQQEQLDSNMAEIANTKALKQELDGLVDVNGNVKAGYEARVNFISNELSKATGIEISCLDGTIAGYQALSEQINNLIEKRKAEILLEAQLPAYKEATLKQEEAKIKLGTFANDLKDIQIQKEKYLQDVESGRIRVTTEGYQYEINRLNLLTAEKQSEYDAQKNLCTKYLDDITAYETNATNVQMGNYQKVSDSYKNAAVAKATAGKSIQETLEKEIAGEENHLALLKGKFKKEKDDITKQNLNSQIAYTESVIAEKRRELTGMSKTITSDVSVSKAYGSLFDKALSIIGSKDFRASGRNLVDGISAGINSRQGRLFNSIASLGTNLLSQFNKSLDIRSPSRKFKQSGAYTVDGVIDGIDETKNKAVHSVETLADEMSNAFKPSFIDEQLMKISNASVNHSSKIAQESKDLANNEISKILVQNSANNISANFSGNIVTKLVIDGREFAVMLAPFISEEIEFN